MRLIRSAAEMVHRQGYNMTTLADIAKDADVPLGNVYYYFKTKDEIGTALIDQRTQECHDARAAWDRLADPRERLLAFVQMTIDKREELRRNGCPIGTLCGELQKEGGTLGKAAARIFDDYLAWLEKQFAAIGKNDSPRDCAVHLLAVLQGATVLAHSFGDPAYIDREATRLQEWIRHM